MIIKLKQLLFKNLAKIQFYNIYISRKRSHFILNRSLISEVIFNCTVSIISIFNCKIIRILLVQILIKKQNINEYMRRNSEQQSDIIFEEAIQKATKLIELLTNQNEQLKIKIRKSDQIIQIISHNNQQAIEYNIKLKTDLNRTQQHIQYLQEELNNACRDCAEMETKIQERIEKNKSLHEKIAEMTLKISEHNKKIEKQNKEILSLNNQNEYLLKQLNNQSQKQNKLINYCDFTEQEFKLQMLNKDRTKQAFARRCEELQIENAHLKKQVLILKTKHLQPRGKQNSPKRVQQVLSTQINKCHFKSPKLNQNDECNIKCKQIDKALFYILNTTLKIKPENQIVKKIDQIDNYVRYRFKHIQTLLEKILNIITQSKNKVQTNNLNEVRSMTKRLLAYLEQLLNQ